MTDCLIVFAKEPMKGKVKTRLSPYLSQTECLKLYKQLLANTLLLARNIKCGKRIIAYDSGDQNPSFLKKMASDFEFYRQKGRDIGERMFDAFKTYASIDAKVVIIGSDSPDLPESYINRAFNELNENDLVLGPAYDGGYYLIGLKKPYRSVFNGIKWSSGSVFDRTLKNAKQSNLKTAILDFWHDIDRREDLIYLRSAKVS